MLLIHPGTLGDVVLSLPAIRMLRWAFPFHEIILSAQAQIGRLFQMCGEIDSVWSMEGTMLSELFQDNPVLHDSIGNYILGLTLDSDCATLLSGFGGKHDGTESTWQSESDWNLPA